MLKTSYNMTHQQPWQYSNNKTYTCVCVCVCARVRKMGVTALFQMHTLVTFQKPPHQNLQVAKRGYQ